MSDWFIKERRHAELMEHLKSLDATLAKLEENSVNQANNITNRTEACTEDLRQRMERLMRGVKDRPVSDDLRLVLDRIYTLDAEMHDLDAKPDAYDPYRASPRQTVGRCQKGTGRCRFAATHTNQCSHE